MLVLLATALLLAWLMHFLAGCRRKSVFIAELETLGVGKRPVGARAVGAPSASTVAGCCGAADASAGTTVVSLLTLVAAVVGWAAVLLIQALVPSLSTSALSLGGLVYPALSDVPGGAALLLLAGVLLVALPVGVLCRDVAGPLDLTRLARAAALAWALFVTAWLLLLGAHVLFPALGAWLRSLQLATLLGTDPTLGTGVPASSGVVSLVLLATAALLALLAAYRCLSPTPSTGYVSLEAQAGLPSALDDAHPPTALARAAALSLALFTILWGLSLALAAFTPAVGAWADSLALTTIIGTAATPASAGLVAFAVLATVALLVGILYYYLSYLLSQHVRTKPSLTASPDAPLPAGRHRLIADREPCLPPSSSCLLKLHSLTSTSSGRHASRSEFRGRRGLCCERGCLLPDLVLGLGRPPPGPHAGLDESHPSQGCARIEPTGQGDRGAKGGRSGPGLAAAAAAAAAASRRGQHQAPWKVEDRGGGGDQGHGGRGDCQGQGRDRRG